MPTYQYTCIKCGHDLEARQSFTDSPLTDCPTCGVGDALRKQFNSVGVVFKGSGFYRNDSRSASGKELSKNDSAGSSDSSATGGSSDTKSQTKSEPKAEKKTETKKADKPKAAAGT